MNRASLAVVIPSREPSSALVACLGSLVQQWPSDIASEIVVVDDGSGEDYSLEIGNWFPPVQLVRLPVQSGPSAARNLGVQATSSEWIVFLDDDCTVPWNWSRSIIDFVTENPHVSMTGAAIYSKRPRNWISQATEDFILQSKVTESGEIRVVSACAIVNRNSFLNVGGFDTRFQQAGGEDWDLSHRMIVAGMTLSITDSIWCYHENPTGPSALIERAWRYGTTSVMLTSQPSFNSKQSRKSRLRFLNPLYLSNKFLDWWALPALDAGHLPFWRRQRGRVVHATFLSVFLLARRIEKKAQDSFSGGETKILIQKRLNSANATYVRDEVNL